jgi:hypothetical protein
VWDLGYIMRVLPDHCSSSMALKIRVDCKASVHIPLDNLHIVSCKGKYIIKGSIYILKEPDKLLPVGLVWTLHPGT